MRALYPWPSITALDVPPETLADEGLRTTLLVWEEQKGGIASPKDRAIFAKMLSREWAEAAGVIEHIDSPNRGLPRC